MAGTDSGMELPEEPFKIGTHERGSGIVEFHYDDVWQRQSTSSPERLLIAPANDHIGILLRLIREMPPPYWVLYVLLVPHSGAEAGRYQLDNEFDSGQIKAFLEDFREFFEGDARHNLWVGSRADSSLLVYDQHDVIYAYGPIDQFAAILTAQGLRQSDVAMPFPHTHHFRSTLDHCEQRLLREFDWQWFPLEEEDDE
jgi:hypothetical protein